jgi:predicted lipoprotein with Yx(FWY)xxD motif
MARRRMSEMRWLGLIALMSLTLLALGCGDDAADEGSEGGPAAAATTASADDAERPAATRKGTTVRVVESQFGRILADGRGQAVYIFDKETTNKSECYGACARAWPPVLTTGRPRAGTGARNRLLGTTRRRNGKSQVTYRGRPLYYYVDDSPGRVLCHNVDEFGGLWLVIRASGKPVG